MKTFGWPLLSRLGWPPCKSVPDAHIHEPSCWPPAVLYWAFGLKVQLIICWLTCFFFFYFSFLKTTSKLEARIISLSIVKCSIVLRGMELLGNNYHEWGYKVCERSTLLPGCHPSFHLSSALFSLYELIAQLLEILPQSANLGEALK